MHMRSYLLASLRLDGRYVGDAAVHVVNLPRGVPSLRRVRRGVLDDLMDVMLDLIAQLREGVVADTIGGHDGARLPMGIHIAVEVVLRPYRGVQLTRVYPARTLPGNCRDERGRRERKNQAG